MDNKLGELEEYFCNKVLTCAARLQAANADSSEKSHLESPLSFTFSCEKFGELLRFNEKLPTAQVIHIHG